jgi:quercetin dioxygenase-like cupin family protein
MQAIHVENVSWTTKDRGVREAQVFAESHGSEETRIDLVEVPPGSYIPAHRHRQRREFLTILHSAGAQLQLGDRIFRPTAGQVFHREPEDVMALTNDTPHPFRYSVTRFQYLASDIEWLASSEAAAP